MAKKKRKKEDTWEIGDSAVERISEYLHRLEEAAGDAEMAANDARDCIARIREIFGGQGIDL